MQAHLPILIGGSGERKTLHTVAKYADAWNTGGDLERVTHKDEVLRRWCDEVGRDESEIERTRRGGVADHPRHRGGGAEGRRGDEGAQPRLARSAATGRSARPSWSPRRWAPYLDLGFDHIYVDCPAPFDHETLERLATEVKPMLEAR